MRKTSYLDAVIPPLRQHILAATLLQPDREWYVTDLAARLGRPPSSLQRDLARLTDTGILLRRREGNRVYVRGNPESPLYPELRQILVKTIGLVDVLIQALAPFAAAIRCAFVHVSVARAAEGADSDVDLIVIGEVGLAELSVALRSARQRLAREVNASVYTPAAFAKKAKSGHHFITKVLAREKLFLVGSPNELDEIAGREASGSRAGNEARAR